MQPIHPAEIIKLKSEFLRRTELRRHQFDQREQNKRRRKEAEQNDMADDDFAAVAQIAVEATALEINNLDSRIDRLSALNMEYISELNEKLLQLELEREQLLDNAHILPDGRRVFKTEDDTKVFDENGNVIGEDVIHPDQIGNEKTRWEILEKNNDAIDSVTRQRGEALTFQDEVDDIKDKLGKDGLTKDEFKDLKERLELNMPLPLRARETALDPNNHDLTTKTAFTASANQIDLSKLEISSPNFG